MLVLAINLSPYLISSTPYHFPMTAHWPDTSRGPCPTVMLRHDLPGDGGSWHVDWMLAREPEAISTLLSFRLRRPLHELLEGEAVHAEHIHDHRPAYLSYEGPISGNRGTVTQIAAGELITVRTGDSGTVELDLRWSAVGDSSEKMRVALLPLGNSGNYQVKWLAI